MTEKMPRKGPISRIWCLHWIKLGGHIDPIIVEACIKFSLHPTLNGWDKTVPWNFFPDRPKQAKVRLHLYWSHHCGDSGQVLSPYDKVEPYPNISYSLSNSKKRIRPYLEHSMVELDETWQPHWSHHYGGFCQVSFPFDIEWLRQNNTLTFFLSIRCHNWMKLGMCFDLINMEAHLKFHTHLLRVNGWDRTLHYWHFFPLSNGRRNVRVRQCLNHSISKLKETWHMCWFHQLGGLRHVNPHLRLNGWDKTLPWSFLSTFKW